MMQRNWFFWMETLQITAAERRVILTLLGIVLVVSGIRMHYPGRTLYDESYYEPVIAEFNRRADVREEERRVILARYDPPAEIRPDFPLRFGWDRTVTPLRAAFEGGSAAPGGDGAVPDDQVPGDVDRTAGTTDKESGLRVNIQEAGHDELVQLPGIGPVTAGRIEAYREENGLFRTPEDLQNVPGIGPRTLENIRPFLILDPIPEAEPSGGPSASTR